MALVKGRELKRRYELDGGEKTCCHLKEALREKELKPDDFSIRDLAENLVPDGREWVQSMNPHGNGSPFTEAVGAVSTASFSNILQQILYTKILDSYNDPAFIGDQLVETIQTEFLDSEKIPGVSNIGDEAETVDEGMPYPLAGLSQEYIETPDKVKRGMIVPVTKEIIFADRTSLMLRNAGKVGYYLGLNREKRIMDVVTGQTNNWSRNGTAYNTYYASAGHGAVNQIANAMTDYTDIEAAENLFGLMTDWNTGEYIDIAPTTLLVPRALLNTAKRILNTTENRVATASAAILAVSPNLHQNAYTLLTSSQVYNSTSSHVKWFLGDFPRAFAYMQNWPVTVTQAPPNSEDDFKRDIVAQFKASERGVACVMDPLYAVYSVGST